MGNKKNDFSQGSVVEYFKSGSAYDNGPADQCAL